MKLKQKPEDFSVKESYRFDTVPNGAYRVYMMDKQKVSTFDAITRIRERFGLKPGAVSYCGLKDKQGRTEQLVAVEGYDIDMQDPDLRLKFLGLTDRPLTSANTTSNRFSVTVRAIRAEELPQLNLAAAEVNRLGVVNYFDDQRFGSLKHGQGFIAKDLLRGDFESALRNFMAVPSALDRTDDAKVKRFWSENWGEWTARCPFEANKKYFRILKSLRDHPTDFVKAFLQIDADYRAMQLFTFQSYLWNEGVRRLLQLLLPREHLFPMRYQAGTLLHHRDAAPEVQQKLRGLTFPLLSPETKFHDEQVREAAMWALGKEKLTLEQLRVEAAPKLLYFKHEERPLLVYPHKLVVGRTTFDELNKPYSKVNVAFTLPPGSYATLVVKRLFHFAPSESGEGPRDAEGGREERRFDGPRKFGRGDGPRTQSSNDGAERRFGGPPRETKFGRGDKPGGERRFGGPRQDRSDQRPQRSDERGGRPFGGPRGKGRFGGGDKPRFDKPRFERPTDRGEQRAQSGDASGERPEQRTQSSDAGGERRFGGPRREGKFGRGGGKPGGKRHFGGPRGERKAGGERRFSGPRPERGEQRTQSGDTGGERHFSGPRPERGEPRTQSGGAGGERRFDSPRHERPQGHGKRPGGPRGPKRPFKPRKFHAK